MGEFAPFDMKSHLGLNFSWIIALTWANASSRLGSRNDDVRIRRRNAGDDRGEVGRLGRIGLIVDRLDPGRLEPRLHVVGNRCGEGVVEFCIGRCLRALVGGERQDIVRKHVAALHHRGGLHEEEVVQVLCEHLRSAAGRLDEGIAVTFCNARRRDGQQAREGSKDDVDFVLRDEVLVVGDDLVWARGVVDDLDLHLSSENARPPC